MIHRLALLMGGAGAAAVLTVALSLGGPPPPAPDAFVPVANDVVNNDQLAQQAPGSAADQSVPQVEKQVQTIYVAPAPTPRVPHVAKPTAGKGDQPNDTARPPRDDGAGDDAHDGDGGDQSRDGGDRSDDGGHEGDD